jgi:hypothetical protein
MVSKQALSILVVFTVIALVNCQFFSSNDGINLPRIGKRSYLGTLLRHRPVSGNSRATYGEDFRHSDKLSFRRWPGAKYGKRADTDDNDNDDLVKIDTADFVTGDNVDAARLAIMNALLEKYSRLSEENSDSNDAAVEISSK